MSDNKTPEQRMQELGYTITGELQLPPGFEVLLSMVKVIDKRVIVSGHGALNPDGTIATHLMGQVGDSISLEQAQEAAKLTALAMVGTLKRELGELSSIKSWVKVLGMVNTAPGFNGQTPVIDGFSRTIIEIFGKECGMACRSAVGMAALPMNLSVEVEAELELH
ncbi:RidA family protein [Thalassotalea nanhaiensis]|uniref:RidA family protein n=1 Tax=Thalassotalea nanhaiensis TaxID=3065648 RepID=A0ABY9TF38_9GAMM|nr:RidA family protein [Colwelliaceae bacterium SQ345]